MHLVDLRSSQAFGSWVREIVRETDRWTLIFGVLFETLSCNHNRDRGLGDKVIREGAKDNTM